MLVDEQITERRREWSYEINDEMLTDEQIMALPCHYEPHTHEEELADYADALLWSAAWKAAAKKWRTQAHAAQIAYCGMFDKWEIAENHKQEVCNKLHDDRLTIAEDLRDCEAERDELRRKINLDRGKLEWAQAWGARAEKQRDELERRLEEAWEVLRRIEWKHPLLGGMGKGCPVCLRNKEQGHRNTREGYGTDCKLDAVLREGE